MFREMRRKAQQLPHQEAERILVEGTSGVLALLGDDGYPYAVPMSYVYNPPYLYFHSAACGHKVDAVKRCGKASFCVVEQDEIHPETLTTHYRSAIAFGQIRLLEDDGQKREALRQIAQRYAPAFMENAAREIEESLDHTHLIALKIEHLTGKEAKELMQKRSAQ